MTFDIPPEIDREFVLSQISEEEIFTYYGVPVVNYTFKSTLRPDTFPTCCFYRSPYNKKLYLRDFSGHFWGDCFDLVIFLHPGTNYYKALKIVAKDFGLISNSGVETERRVPSPPDVEIEVRDPVNIRVQRRQWNKYDARYWKQFGITRVVLEHFNVAPVTRVWVEGKLDYNYPMMKPENTAYVYHFGGNNYKIYYPFRDKRRFLHNDGSILQGYEQLPESGEALVITKSYKDVIKLHQYGIPAIAPMSESQIVETKMLDYLKSKFRIVAALYDCDRTGIHSLIKYRSLGVLCLWFPRNQPKDITDYYKKYGDEDTHLLVEQVKSNFL